MSGDRSLYEIVFDRVADDESLPERAKDLVLASFTGDDGFARVLAGEQAALEPDAQPKPERVPDVFLSAITATGFRGIGPAAELRLTPGPGLTVITGRNGSGKSSFAEAAELAVTGENRRWAARNNESLWRDGWYNRHWDGAREITVDLVIAGQGRRSTVRMAWDPDAGVDERTWTVQHHPGKRETFDARRWHGAHDTYRPFLSYNELGSLLDRRPYDQYLELHRLLGLEVIESAGRRLADARKERAKRVEAARHSRKAVLAQMREIDDPRARRAVSLLNSPVPSLDAIAELAAAGDVDDSVLAALRAVVRLELPDESAVRAAADAVVRRAAGVTDSGDSESKAAASVADLLDRALVHHSALGDGPCPVCGSGRLDESWETRARRELTELRARTRDLREAQQLATAAVNAASELVEPVPAVLAALPDDLDAGTLVDRWQDWERARTASPQALGETLPRLHAQLSTELRAVQARARQALARLDEVWRPAVANLIAHHREAVLAEGEKPLLRELKAAEDWLKATSAVLRDERFALFAGRSQEVWEKLRQQSGITLDDIRLQGSGTMRKMIMEVSVDGTGATALGVMSQGELHSLALSLFLPRATSVESPFRFLVIDDPVQSMDPAKVDGLARTLAEHATDRQVVVFTHDDRLAASARRLGLGATILDVTRLDRSVVNVETSSDPIERYLSDAAALARTTGLPEFVQRDLVAINCRNALEAAAIRRAQANLLGEGHPHNEVDELLAQTSGPRERLALALFGDTDRRRDVDDWFRRRHAWAPQVLKVCAGSGHGDAPGDLRTLVERTTELARLVRR